MKHYVLKNSSNAGASLPDDFLAGLNHSQREAVMHVDGPCLVIAGAGSGKTRTLVHRVAKLVADGITPDAILLLTFTRKSAQEMLTRAANILDDRCRNISGGTFHGFANITLRRFAKEFGYSSNFTILDRGDAEDLIQAIRKECGYDKLGKRFPKKGSITNVISKSVNTEKSVESILAKEFPQYVEFAKEIEDMKHRFRHNKDQMQVMDYDDLLVKLLALLQHHPHVCETLQQQYRFIMVDEYQDTNAIQADIVKHLANQSCNVMVVGDDSQSIYAFRGAHFKNIMNFPNSFPNTRVITLEQNYRSIQPILDLTNAMIANAKEKYSKNLFTNNESENKPVYMEFENENTQSKFVAQKVLELRESGIPLNRIAVLIRSGWHSNDLEVELTAQNIPFTKFGGFKFVESAHIKDVISYLRIMMNPKDRLSWMRGLLLIEGIGPKGATTLFNDLHSTPDALGKYRKKAYFEELKQLLGLITRWDVQNTPVSTLMDAVITYYKPLFKLKYEDYHKRSNDLDSIATIAERYTRLQDFLSEMSLEPPENTQVASLPEDSDDEKLVISTIHSAKGLEWHSVFILSTVDGYLPSFQSLGDIAQLEEERRLLYVALTRAEQNLFILKPHLEPSGANYYRQSGMTFSKLSRFLDEGKLMDRYTEKWAIVEEKPKNDFVFDPFGDRQDSDIDNSSSRRRYYF